MNAVAGGTKRRERRTQQQQVAEGAGAHQHNVHASLL
jgi:hypothetical protein